MTDLRRMRTWAEIDLDALAHNYHTLRALAPWECKFLGLVKANAYGHGAVPVARKLQSLGADMLAVACFSEALELRQGGITIPILCLGRTPEELYPLLIEYDVIQTVEDLDSAKAMSQAAVQGGKSLSVHVKLDTGMGRLGFLWRKGEDNVRILDDIQAVCTLPGLKVEGMFTHFADADSNDDFYMDQLTRFLDARTALEERGIKFQIYHCGASSAVLNYPCTHMDMIRPGIALYGYYPAPGMEGLDGPGLEPVMSVKSRIAAVRSLPAGTSVSYGCTVTLQRDSKVAVIPIGYGDGYPRCLSNRMTMEIRGQACPILGRICMDMTMVDVTDLPEVQVGDTAVVYGQGMEEAARLSGTIVYELLCDLTPRVPRIYLEQGQEVN